MSSCSNAQFAAPADGTGAPRVCGGPPLPVKVAAVVAAFLICRPLGLAALAFVLWRSYRGGHGPSRGFGPARGFGLFRRAGVASTGNSVLDEKQHETLKELDEEAKAFAEFQKKQREARDKEAFDRFAAERGADKAE